MRQCFFAKTCKHILRREKAEEIYLEVISLALKTCSVSSIERREIFIHKKSSMQLRLSDVELVWILFSDES